MGLRKQTVVEFRNYLSGCVLAEIKGVFEAADIPLPDDFQLPTSGQRRALVDAYLKAIDLSDPASVSRILESIEYLLVKLTVVIEREGTSTAADGHRHSRNNLLHWLRRDGFDFRNGRLRSTEANDHETAVVPSQDQPEPGVTPANAEPPVHHPKVFLSYSWEGPEHQAWVKDLATKLRSHGVDVTLDRWKLAPGDQLPRFMETAVRENEHVLVVCTRKYKVKSDSRIGGVGYEGDIMTGEVYNGQNARKFIPIWREAEWKDAAPSWLAGTYRLDFRGEPYSDESYQDLLHNLYGTREEAPPLGSRPMRHSGAILDAMATFTPPPADTDPIKIKGIVLDEIGRPRNDGTHGSALYTVPFKLSRRPSSDWARHFVQTWDRPPSYTLMHRPGICRVVGDRIILDGTTVEEVEKYHRDTLKLVLEKVNRDIEEHEAEQKRLEEQQIQRQRDLEQAAKRISFD